MSLLKRKNRLRQKAVIRVANKPWNTLKWTLIIGFAAGFGVCYSLSFFMR